MDFPFDAPTHCAPWVNTPIDTSEPSIARVYDAVLGGKDNFAADREVALKFLEVPGAQVTPFDNRRWLKRVTQWLVGQARIRQIIDLGSGLPTTSSIHEFAGQVADDVRVVYVDNDPSVLAHGRALLATSDNTTVVTGDVCDTDALLTDPDLLNLIDVERPFAVLLASVLHHLPDGEDQRVAAHLRAHLRPGCYLAIANFHNPAPAIRAPVQSNPRSSTAAWAQDGCGPGPSTACTSATSTSSPQGCAPSTNGAPTTRPRQLTRAPPLHRWRGLPPRGRSGLFVTEGFCRGSESVASSSSGVRGGFPEGIGPPEPGARCHGVRYR